MPLKIKEWNDVNCPYCEAALDDFDLEQFLDDYGTASSNQVSVVQRCPECDERVEITINFTITAMLSTR